MRILLLYFLVFTSLQGIAQWTIGLGGGLASNQLQADIANRPQQQLQAAGGLAFELPICYSIPLTKKNPAGNFTASLQASIHYIQKGYELNRTDSLQGLDQQYRNNYIQVPLVALIGITQNPLTFQVGAGFYQAYWISGHVKGGMPNIFNTALAYPAAYSYNESYVFDNRKDNRWENGWVLEGRLSYATQHAFDLFVAAHFFQSLTDQQKAYMLEQIPRYNSTWAFTVGIQKKL